MKRSWRKQGNSFPAIVEPDTEENLRGIFSFMREVGLPLVDLLPYNISAGAKYEWLDLPYEVEGETQDGDRLAGFVRMARGEGLEATVG